MNNIIDHVDKNTRFSPAMQKKNREISQLFTLLNFSVIFQWEILDNVHFVVYYIIYGRVHIYFLLPQNSFGCRKIFYVVKERERDDRQAY